MRIVIAGGGTGGHCLPALAVHEKFQRRNLDAEWLWIGSDTGVEAETAAKAEVPFRSIQAGKLRRYFSFKTATDAVRIPIGAAQAWTVLRGFRPDVVFSTGGFVSVPTVFAASRMTPIITHEQTAILGLATELNMRFADVLAVSYEDTVRLAQGWKGRIAVTGNAVRPSFDHGDSSRAMQHFGFKSDIPLLYVTGGARGASALNHLVAQLLPDALDQWQILHQTGPSSANDDAATLRQLGDSLPDRLRSHYKVVEFLNDEIADVFAAASLVLSRAGAGTVAELAYLGKPSILIPLPGAGGDEQRVNANVLGNAGGAIVIDQSEATRDRIQSELARLAADQTVLASMAANAKSVGKPDAAAKLTDLILEIAKSGSP